MDWRLGRVFARHSERAAVTLAGLVGLSAVGELLDGLLTAVLVGSEGCFPGDLVLVLRLAALSSSSEEISTTIWADIMCWRFLVGLDICALGP